jgi:hypothetical protein
MVLGVGRSAYCLKNTGVYSYHWEYVCSCLEERLGLVVDGVEVQSVSEASSDDGEQYIRGYNNNTVDNFHRPLRTCGLMFGKEK